MVGKAAAESTVLDNPEGARRSLASPNLHKL